MADATDGGKRAKPEKSPMKATASAEARRFGTRPLSALLPRIVRPAFGRRSAATATLLTDWAAIVGPADAAALVPVKLVAGVLTIGCDGPAALELQHREARLVERINGALGEPIVRRVRLVRGAPRVAPAPATVAPPWSRAAPDAVPDVVPGAPDGPLGDALARLRAAMDRTRQRA